jgi:hypothetical protein
VLACPARFQSVIEARRQQGPLAVLSKIGPSHGQLFPNLVMEELPTIGELACAGSNRNADYRQF